MIAELVDQLAQLMLVLAVPLVKLDDSEERCQAQCASSDLRWWLNQRQEQKRKIKQDNQE